jgi:ribosome-binding protein aMBF1 (putative translation factor)
MKEVGEMKPSRSWDKFKAELMQDAEFAQIYQELEPEYQVARQMIALRLKRGLSQEQLAEYVGTKQSGISRLETAGTKPNLGLLERVAEALDARVEIRLVPRSEAHSVSAGARAKRHVSSRQPAGKRARVVA